MGDLINRQDAIMHFVKASKNYECGMFNIAEVTQELWKIASAQPEIIMCKDCKYAHLTYDGECKYCDMWTDDDGRMLKLYADGDFYCADAERK